MCRSLQTTGWRCKRFRQFGQGNTSGLTFSDPPGNPGRTFPYGKDKYAPAEDFRDARSDRPRKSATEVPEGRCENGAMRPFPRRVEPSDSSSSTQSFAMAGSLFFPFSPTGLKAWADFAKGDPAAACLVPEFGSIQAAFTVLPASLERSAVKAPPTGA